MQNLDAAGLDKNAWPQDVFQAASSVITAPQVDTNGTRTVTFAFPSVRLSASAQQDLNLAVPFCQWRRAEVRLWVVCAATASGNVRWRLRSYPMTDGTDAAVAAFSPVESFQTLPQSTTNVLKAVDLGVIALGPMTAVQISRMGADVLDTSAQATDVIAVMFRDADALQR